jgi:hypothetical protein
MPKNLPKYVPGGHGEKFAPASAKWGFWREPVSPDGFWMDI